MIRKRIFRLVGKAMLLAMPLVVPLFASAQTTAFNFSGKLSNVGLPVNGTYDLQFRVYGSEAGSDLISGPINVGPVGIKGGIFTSKLDFGEAVFSGSARWLAVAVRPTGSATYTNLSPRIEITTAPYAIRARSAATADSFTSGAVVTALNTLSGNVTLQQGTNVNITQSGNTLTINSSASGGGGGAWSTLGTNAYYNTGNVGVGTTTPATKLDVRGSLTLDTGGNATIYTGVGGSELNRYLNLINSPISPSASGLKAGGLLVSDSYAYANPGKNDLIVKGNVGIGTASPAANLDVAGMIRIASQDAFRIDGYQPFITMDDTSAVGGPWLVPPRRYIQVVDTGMHFLYRPGCTTFPCPTGNAIAQMSILGSGNVGIGTTTPATRLDVFGDITGNRLVLRADPFAPNNAAVLCGDSAVTTFVPYNTATGRPLDLLARDLIGTRLILAADPAAPTHASLLTGDPAVDLFVPYNTATSRPLNLLVRDATVRQITITGGVDLAEPFQMSHEGVSKGSVVIIDEENPGQLKLSTRAYDKRVAGIVSGANGIQPGISLHQAGVVEGGENVALSGRVYVQADAGYGAIKPGDLLTTSDTPGHAMKVIDSAQAQGAILGKAMTALDHGKGMVLVLVTLQ